MLGPVTNSLEDQGRALVKRLGGRWSGGGGLCRCPAHEDRSPSLSVRIGRERLLLHCFAGCSASDVLRALRRSGYPLQDFAAPGDSGSAAVRPGDRSRGAAVRLWSIAGPIEGTPAEAYLHGRALKGGSAELRYLPRTPHGPRPLTCFRPALIAAVRDETGLVAIHRTFLEPRSRSLAAIEEPRCGLGRFASGAVRLGGTAPKLGLAEGIETALSASALFGIPCWATLGTERFKLVALPAEVSELVLFLDNDAGGRRAEALARQTFPHLSIEARYPQRPGSDWNDGLRAGVGQAGTP
jgi:putative DNA primase/helicase